MSATRADKGSPSWSSWTWQMQQRIRTAADLARWIEPIPDEARAIEALERDLVADGVRFLQVKTLGPSDPDAGYQRTRQFYAGVGFEPLEEITGLWPGNPCLIMVKPLPLSLARLLRC